MKSFPRFIAATCLLFICSVTTETLLAQSTSPKASDRGFMPVSEIKPGMKGRSLTVFEGTEPEEFEVEIVGVVPGSLGPRQDMIVGRISGGKADRTSVFAGMSGSPVYIDGRLVGAISFAFPFAKEPLCGITPIEQMVDIFETESMSGKRGSVTVSWNELSAVANSKMREDASDRSRTIDPSSNLRSVAGQFFTPIGVPLSFSGIDRRTLELFAPQLKSLGLVPVSAVAGSASLGGIEKITENTLIGGRSISVQLARGDYSLVASGTATLRDGERVYAFGHPFLSLGGVEMPMSESSVVVVVPNINNSFKLAVPGPMVGTMLQDRATGIMGELGRTARMIPVNLKLTTSRGKREDISFEIVRDEFLTPLVLNIGLVNSVLANERHIGDTTVTTNAVIKIKGHESVVIERDFTGAASTTLSSVAVTLPVTNLLRGRFDDLEIESIDVSMIVKEGTRTGVIENLRAQRSEFRAGDKVKLTVFTRIDSGKPISSEVEFTIPNDLQPGNWSVTVADATSAQENSSVNSFTATSLREMIDILNRGRRDDRLYLQLHRTGGSVVMGTSEMPNLPISVLATMNSGRNSAPQKTTSTQVVLDNELPPTEYPVAGKQTLEIRVLR